MLVPALLYKTDLEEKFASQIYEDRYFYYMGNAFCYELPNIKPDSFAPCKQYAILTDDEDERLIGYLAYTIDPYASAVYNFGLYSFEEGNVRVIRDTFTELEKLTKQFHRIEWRCVGGNHALNGYRAFCKKHNGTEFHLHDTLKDKWGNFVDSYIFEIINPEK